MIWSAYVPVPDEPVLVERDSPNAIRVECACGWVFYTIPNVYGSVPKHCPYCVAAAKRARA